VLHLVNEILAGRATLERIWHEVTDEEHSAIVARVQRAYERRGREVIEAVLEVHRNKRRTGKRDAAIAQRLRSGSF
jgi:hypothetical protein